MGSGERPFGADGSGVGDPDEDTILRPAHPATQHDADTTPAATTDGDPSAGDADDADTVLRPAPRDDVPAEDTEDTILRPAPLNDIPLEDTEDTLNPEAFAPPVNDAPAASFTPAPAQPEAPSAPDSDWMLDRAPMMSDGFGDDDELDETRVRPWHEDPLYRSSHEVINEVPEASGGGGEGMWPVFESPAPPPGPASAPSPAPAPEQVFPAAPSAPHQPAMPMSSAPTVGTPAAGAPVPGYPVPGSPASGTPAVGAPAPGHPAPGSPASGAPASGSPLPGSPAGSPAPGSPAPGSPASGSPAPTPAYVPDHAPIRPFDRRPRFASALSAPSPSEAEPDPQGSLPPGVDATEPRRRRGAVVAVAFGCAMLLLLGLGGGGAAWWLWMRDDPSAQAEEDAAGHGAGDNGTWKALESDQTPSGTTEELVGVLAENPLTAATLPVPVSCELPAVSGLVPEQELQGFLDAGAACLESMWSDALAAQDVEFTGPRIKLWTPPETPGNSACRPEEFSDAPRACLADDVLYWPTTWDPGFSNTQDAETAQLYMWHLSYTYAVFAISAVDLDAYYGAAIAAVGDDIEASDTLRRRYGLQLSCLGAASSFQMPEGVRPSDRVASFVTSPEAQADPTDSSHPSVDARALWVVRGQQARGGLSSCTTWTAPDAEVA